MVTIWRGVFLGAVVLGVACGRFGFGQQLPDHCTNQIQDQEESGIDCGGVCAACSVGETCKFPTDCESKVCEQGACQAATCNDGVRNGDEMDADCGGSCVGRCLYISPSGSDVDPGTKEQPWRTWAQALGALQPGDTLTARDGTYNLDSGTGYLLADCDVGATICGGLACQNGTEEQPILIRAENARRAFFQWQVGVQESTIVVGNCSHWTLDGFHTANGDHDDGTNSTGAALLIENANRIVIRSFLATNGNRYRNAPVLYLKDSVGILVEDSEVYDFHRRGIWMLRVQDSTLRRNYFNSRNTNDIVGGFPSNCPTVGDRGISSHASAGLIIENNVVENVCKGIEIRADVGIGARGGDEHLVVGNIVLGAIEEGYKLLGECGGQDPCTDPAVIASDNRFVNNVAVDTETGFESGGGQNNVFEHSTTINHSRNGFLMERNSVSLGMTSSAFIENSLAFGGGIDGFEIADQDSWGATFVNSFGHGNNYNAHDNVDDNLFSNFTEVDPQFGECRVYVPIASPMAGAGKDGADIGANVIFRYEEGVVTSVPLWNESDGSFPCGLVRSGINDGPSDCSTVHQRLNVGTNQCPLPSSL